MNPLDARSSMVGKCARITLPLLLAAPALAQTPQTQARYTLEGGPIAPAEGTVLWEQLPDELGVGFVDQEFPDFADFSTYMVNDVTFTDAVTLDTVSIWTTSNTSGGGFELITEARLNVFENDPLLATDDPVTGVVVPVTVTLDGSSYRVDAAGLALDLDAGEYWIGLSPIGEFGVIGQEFHLESPVLSDESNARNPGGGFVLGTDWGLVSALFGDGTPFDGSIRVTGSVQVGCGDDAIEDNDTLTSGFGLGDGVINAAVVDNDDDYWRTVVCPGDTVTFTASFIDDNGDLDLELFDAEGNLLDNSDTVTDMESVTYTNMTGEVVTVVGRVFLFFGLGCNEYLLEVSGSCSIGASYCEQNANSTGDVARIQVAGSIFAADDDLSLAATGMPAAAPGYFTWSTATGITDLPALGLSDGFLCLGSGKGRFNATPFVAGPGGSAYLQSIDTTMMPQGMGPIAIMAGDTGYFQGWFRDGTSNNFTDAVEVIWQ